SGHRPATAAVPPQQPPRQSSHRSHQPQHPPPQHRRRAGDAKRGPNVSSPRRCPACSPNNSHTTASQAPSRQPAMRRALCALSLLRRPSCCRPPLLAK
ncbi:hypothetical protein SVAN01_11313, partial [Stagonosporopsis vannaccii]